MRTGHFPHLTSTIGRACHPGPKWGAVMLLALAPAAFGAAAPSASQTPAPGGSKGKTAAAPADSTVVARVNGHPILTRDFDLAVQLQFRGRRKPLGLKELQAARDKVLESLIDNELLYQKAAKSDAPVPDHDVEEEFEKIKKAYPTEEEFTSVLKQGGVSETDFKDQLRRSLVVTRFVDREVTGDIKVSDEEVRRYYDQNPTEMNRRESVHLAQILMKVGPNTRPDARTEAREKIEAVLKELRSGADFAELARRYSEGREAPQGGDAGWVVVGSGLPAIDRAVAALQPGQISDVVESRVGFHILEVLERRPAGPLPFDQAKGGIRDKLVARERKEKIEAYVGKLKEQARVERNLKTTS